MRTSGGGPGTSRSGAWGCDFKSCLASMRRERASLHQIQEAAGLLLRGRKTPAAGLNARDCPALLSRRNEGRRRVSHKGPLIQQYLPKGSRGRSDATTARQIATQLIGGHERPLQRSKGSVSWLAYEPVAAGSCSMLEEPWCVSGAGRVSMVHIRAGHFTQLRKFWLRERFDVDYKLFCRARSHFPIRRLNSYIGLPSLG